MERWNAIQLSPYYFDFAYGSLVLNIVVIAVVVFIKKNILKVITRRLNVANFLTHLV